jgi:hypothetical protein
LKTVAEKTPVVIKTEDARTSRGAKIKVRLVRRRLTETFYTVEARYADSGAILAEHTTSDPASAAMASAAYVAGVYDLSTPLADLPPGLSRAMGRAYLDATKSTCGLFHVTGAKHCHHPAEDLLKPLARPNKIEGLPRTNLKNRRGAAR